MSEAAEEPSSDEKPSQNGDVKTPEKSLARRIAPALVLAVLVIAGLLFYADVDSLGEHLRDFSWLSFFLALLLATANYALRFLRWQVYLRRLSISVPVTESALIFLSGFVMSITPGKVGEVFKSLLLFESRGVPFAKSAPIVLAERLTDLLALVILLAVGSFSFEGGWLLASIGAGAVLLILVASSWRYFGELCIRIASRLPVLSRFAPRLSDAYDSLHAMTRPAPLLSATALSTVSWALECFALYLILGGFAGVAPSLSGSFFAYSVSTVAGALAFLTPGGLGVTEAGMASALEAVGGGGIDASVAAGATLLVRLATLWWAVAIGALALLLFRRSMRGRAPVGEAQPDLGAPPPSP